MAGTAYNGVPTFAIAALPQPPNKAPQSNAFAKTPRPLNEKLTRYKNPRESQEEPVMGFLFWTKDTSLKRYHLDEIRNVIEIQQGPRTTVCWPSLLAICMIPTKKLRNRTLLQKMYKK